MSKVKEQKSILKIIDTIQTTSICCKKPDKCTSINVLCTTGVGNNRLKLTVYFDSLN